LYEILLKFKVLLNIYIFLESTKMYFAMNKALTRIIVCVLLSSTFVVNAQQDVQFTKYMFVPSVFNPAYAGSRDHLSMTLLHRSQWVGIKGAPTSQGLAVHSPLNNDKVGLGFTAVNDAVGANRILNFNAQYAYRIPIKNGKLAIGLQAGIKNWNFNGDVNPEVPGVEFPAASAWKPNFGVGVHYYSKYFFTSFACPQLIEWDLTKNASNPINARQYRHFYGSIGGAIPLNGDALVLRPMVMVKNVGWFSGLNKDANYQKIGAPTSIDVDLSLFFYQTLWVGAAYRGAAQQFKKSADGQQTLTTGDSFDIWASYFLENGLRIGAAYDFPLTKLQNSTIGSFEIMLGYEFDYKSKRFATPRYF
jgi:type IX secretion system PorP/SprF family membrane protein